MTENPIDRKLMDISLKEIGTLRIINSVLVDDYSESDTPTYTVFTFYLRKRMSNVHLTMLADQIL